MFRDNNQFSDDTTRPDLGPNPPNPDDKLVFSSTSLDFLPNSHLGPAQFKSNPPNSTLTTGQPHAELRNEKVGFSGGGGQELTLSYLCDHPPNPNSTRSGLKGKGLVLEGQEDKWVERDFLQLSDSKDGGCSSKRELEQEIGNINKGESKKPKVELSLALPDVSLSLTASNAAPRNPGGGGDLSCMNKDNNDNEGTMTRSLSFLNNTRTTCSNDFTGASLSYSYSHPFSHNPSCSLTRNSTENYENSVRSGSRDTDRIWNCGEGTNGSVHSRFKPIGGDGVTFLSSHGNGGVGHALLSRGRLLNRDLSNSLYREAGSDTSSFFPSELPARPKAEYGGSIGRSLDQIRGLDCLEERRSLNLSMGEKIVRDVLVESIPSMSKLFQVLPSESIESAKKYLHGLISAASGRKDELVELQNLLQRRGEFQKETLSKAHKVQLEILVAVKFELSEYVSDKGVHLPTSELVEICLSQRCPNVNCKSLLPVDDCDCKICSSTKGFCSQCMCPICRKFDCAINTCSWVGCDACSHWSHAFCALEKNFIRRRPNLKGSSSRTTEMQFYCLGCGHASEMFGFVKDVFISCAKEWPLETLIKELDCVRRIFKGSDDLKGKELYLKAAELITRLERRAMSPSDACNFIIGFFTSKPDKEDTSDSQAVKISTSASQGALLNERAHVPSPKSSTFAASNILKSLLPYDLSNSSSKQYVSFEDDLSRTSSRKEDTATAFDSLDSIVCVKEAEARMFQNRADEARKEVDAYRQLVQTRTQKLEQEYADKLAKLCLPEAEERRRKKLEELKLIETSHADYYNMKMRMQDEIRGLLQRMEATKQEWAI